MNPDDHFESMSDPTGAPPFRAEYREPRPPRHVRGLHVDLAQDWEVQLWTRHFRCTEAQLRRAVQAAGNEAEEVRVYLRRNG